MQIWIALLRGINVGKHHRIAMADLILMMRDLGFENPGTLLNSGNLYFSSNEVSESAIKQAFIQGLAERFNLNNPVMVFPLQELENICLENPFPPENFDPAKVQIGILSNQSELSQLKTLNGESKTENWHIGQHAVYVYCAQGVHQSQLIKAIESRLKQKITFRNLNTLNKLSKRLKP
ncbi:hypothetical protein COW36_08615 [bacterium (Candidatus Blackallbacteria) CG17_big_fil_post_rev_8_21_14_2_50_48_46]|uniref:DUF1697 domain-containing protein n=1 Tax=bacterium (Candidatus Blackallbacteria) CG17_big_fil_post_rev_8_21_14_2_50_48_46 TaxID=2014261 RepID=A0A2M7G6H8_9BACT|nr:MAG: hypothetical protein COW64_05915 [bacterium (Candidatus Blackallbacteria) CG18_big_fil_WC_8_21_14_2_50_49_26]PIW17549.1 MAG: hypothetical protein COW36_08615 [bacterium (Candidatus Blackallbacteria) CG17_big_fil_post_rev_8_21_14_2_50_48_46]PIW48404.1 MAG: hypothetical protein COW20_09965 [bacterium (Candidatus Blackallbacteria) CG13_big_fil_rev_8_21_14_2_50_49_14]